MACVESHKSRRKNTDGTIERIYIVSGTTDDVQAEAEAFAKAPPSYRGLIRNPRPDVVETDREIYEVTFTYQAPDGSEEEEEQEPQGEFPTLGTLEVDTSGGTEHVTQCLSQVAYSNSVTAKEIVERRIVGLHKDGVNGVDIDNRANVWRLTKKWLPAAITGAYLRKLDRLSSPSKVNQSPYTIKWAFRGNKYERTFEAGELRFLGYKASTSFTIRGTGVWEISYEFLFSGNRDAFELTTGSASIIVKSKKGHEYLWVMYKKEELTGDVKAAIEVPEVAFVSKLYEEANFAQELGF